MISLDVVAGALISCQMFWRLAIPEAKPDLATLILLGITTWVIYITDRLLDLKIYPDDFTERHRFHSDNQFNLSVLLIVLLILAFVLVFFIPKSVLLFGMGLALFLLIYFVLLNRLFRKEKLQWLKEPVTAISYTAAVSGIVLVQASSILLSTWILAGMFFLVASQNLLLFSLFECLQKPDSENSASFFGLRNSRKIIRIIGFLVLFLSVLLFSGGQEFKNYVGLILAVMALTLSFISAKSDWFLVKERYRYFGDGVFLIPLILLFFFSH